MEPAKAGSTAWNGGVRLANFSIPTLSLDQLSYLPAPSPRVSLSNTTQQRYPYRGRGNSR